MLYVIVCLIKHEAHEFHEDLVKDICAKYEVKRQKLQSHFTIKAPFETDEIESVGTLVKEFSQNHCRSSFTMENYGHFGDRVAYMNIEPSKGMIETCRSFLLVLRDLPWLEWKRNENGKPIFHCTVVSKLPKGKFEDIWPYLLQHPFKFKCSFDNITIMQWNKDKWVIHESFPLKEEVKEGQ
jgi:2'-5' RNA ligase